jgi:hypothetical protein
VFDIGQFIEACRLTAGGSNPPGHVRELMEREFEHSDEIAAVLGGRQAGLDVLYNGADLTVLNVIWAPQDPDTLLEEPYNLEQVRRLFAAANDEWRSQLGQDLDESAQD